MLRIGKGKALALLARHQQKCTYRSGLTDAKSYNIVFDVLHGVIDRQASRNRSTRRVDVKLNVLLRILAAPETASAQ